MNQFTTIDDGARKVANAAINRTVRLGKSGLRVKKMNLDSIYVAGFSDASLGNNDDFSSQIGGVVCLRDAKGNYSLVSFFSRTSPA